MGDIQKNIVRQKKLGYATGISKQYRFNLVNNKRDMIYYISGQ